ncbi:MAG TPA: MFS transporter [Chloroflexota bacterium]|jgi:sugar phosphate permease
MKALAHLKSIYPGWWVALGSSLSLGVVAGTTFWAFGLLAAPLEAEFGWSRSMIAAAVSMTLLVSGLASPLVGRLVDRYGPRAVILVGSAATAATFALLARVEQLWQLFVLLALLAFFRTWIFYVPFTTLVTRWFTRRRATAMGIATSGFGIGGLVVLPVVAEVVSSVGWRASFLLAAGLVVLVNGTLAILVSDAPPVRWAEVEVGDARARFAQEGIWRIDSAGAAMRAPVFWLMAAGFALFFFAQWAFLFHGPQFLEQAGFAPRDAALVFGCAAGLGVLLRLSSGTLIDRVRRVERLAAAVLCTMAAAVLLLTLGASPPLLVVFALLWGVGSGIGPALEPLLVGRAFGRKHYAVLYGTMDGVDTVVSIPGPWLGGVLFDLSGTYTPVLLLYGVAFLAGAAGFALLARLTVQHENPQLVAGARPQALVSP